ncbi:MAG: DNA-formamidopyrimidine glycosylase, partial [Actinobacteria bacterium]|nr:DNA-formamidopyrimidine glycosylase [Actinomycetota bacterium]
AQVAHIARDPLDPLFDDDVWRSQLKRKDTEIKRALLDQTLVSGIGNIYADEALWQTKLHYLTPGARLKESKVRETLEALRQIMQRAIAAGGTSFDEQYVRVNGDSGWFEVELNAYGQEGEPCARCGRQIVREAWSNRSSHRCPRCQPARNLGG